MKKKLKIKLGRTVWIVLSLGILLIMTGSLWYYRTQQLAEQQQLQTEQDTLQDRLSGLDVGQLQIEQQKLLNDVALANQAYLDIVTLVSEPIDSIAASDRLFSIANNLDITITDISIADPFETKIENINCAVLLQKSG